MSARHANISIFVPHLGCPNMCSFCNQHHIARTEKVPDAQAVRAAVEIAMKSKNYSPENTEIAFFGGSFTAIEPALMTELLSAAAVFAENGTVSGIRISTRPDAIDGEILQTLKKYGVSVIELGAQSMDDGVLTANNRGHRAEDVKNASRLIKSFDFKLGLQMMTGLYKSTDELDLMTASELINLQPDEVRIYPTVTLRDTRLEQLYRDGVYIPPTLEESAELCGRISAMFEAEGIRVIRLGLHTIDESAYVAGPWHPAFKEICDSLVFRRKISKEISVSGVYRVAVNPKSLSRAIGQKKSNIEYFKKQGCVLKIFGDEDIKENELSVKGCE